MTDFDKMLETFTALGVEHQVKTAAEEHGETPANAQFHGSVITFDTSILLEYGNGYSGFECWFYFLEGKYQGHAVVE